MQRKVLLMILDGFGYSTDQNHNAIFLAKKPNLDRVMKNDPHCLLQTSGKFVGLPDGIMGNSEVGHLNIGAGRVIKQELVRITDFAKEQGFETFPDVKRVMTETKGALHFMGLLSDGSVHSHQEHLFALIEAAHRVNCPRPIYVHVITDGRDTPPQSALTYVAALEKVLKRFKGVKVATLGGRYYMMDRDKRWDRTKLAYDALIDATAPIAEVATMEQAIKNAYAAGENDEFIKPVRIQGGARIRSEDALITFNYRADRMRQICRALGMPDFKEFPTPVKLAPQNLVTFTRYEEAFPFPTLFKPQVHSHLLGEMVAEKGAKQLRIAETEKYAHVTYFFNGGEEKVYPSEDRVLVPSPKEVATYDQKPEMSARQVTTELLKKMESTDYALIVLNYANSDMVGHTGNEPAAIKAVETLDACIGDVLAEAKRKGYDVIITADHGNSECMVDPITKAPHTAHTTNPVPMIWIPAEGQTTQTLKDGILADVAPTILKLLGWTQPKEMTGHSLLSE